MAAGIDLSAYKELVLVLGTAAIIVPAVVRYGLNPIFGFLAAGAILGPDGLGQLVGHLPLLSWITVSDRTQIAYLAEAGVVFLLFMIGLELSFERLWTMRRLVFGLGALQVLITGAVLTAVLRYSGVSTDAALVLGFAFSLSSTALVVQLLADQKRLGSLTGRTSFAILLFQDIAVVPLLVLVGVLGQAGGVSLWEGLGLAGLKAIGAIGGILLLGRYILRPLFRAVAHTKSGDLFMAASLLVVIGTGLITAASGLSMALGAFVAGLILAETEFRREIEATIEPFKGLLVGVFFFSVGMSLDAASVIANPVAILASLTLLILLKAIIIYVLARLFRAGIGTALETAILTAPAGEFAFVILALAGASKLVPDATITAGIAVASLSMLLNPALAALGQRLRRWVQPAVVSPAESRPLPPMLDEAPHVILAGYGRVGELVGNMLKEHTLSFVALDTNPDLVALGHKAGLPVYFGNAADVDMLKRVGLDGAKVLVITMDSRKAVEEVSKAARAGRPDLTIVARARDQAHAAALYAAGVTEAVPEAVEASLHISEAALIGAGLPLGLVIASIHERRDQYRASFQRISRGDRDPVAKLRARRTALKKKGT
jgi:monovalent cation:H+ antiporter-2, CPA2 family